MQDGVSAHPPLSCCTQQTSAWVFLQHTNRNKHSHISAKTFATVMPKELVRMKGDAERGGGSSLYHTECAVTCWRSSSLAFQESFCPRFQWQSIDLTSRRPIQTETRIISFLSSPAQISNSLSCVWTPARSRGEFPIVFLLMCDTQRGTDTKTGSSSNVLFPPPPTPCSPSHRRGTKLSVSTKPPYFNGNSYYDCNLS